MVFSKKISEFSDNDQLDLWYELIGTRQLYKPVLSCLRPDNKIGGNVYLDYYRNKYRLTDFTNKEFHNIDVFDAIKLKYGFNQAELLDFLKNRSCSPSPKRVRESIDKKCYLNFQPFDGYYKSTIEYFKTYGITQEQLWADGVRNTSSIHVNLFSKKKQSREVFIFHPKRCHAIFTFEGGNSKVYQPLEEDRFPLSNTTKEDVWKIDNGSEYLIIGSSYKDIRVACNITSNLIDAISPQSEGLPVMIEKAFIEEVWKWILKHKSILICGDDDAAGHKFQQRLVDYIPQAIGFKYPELPKYNLYNKKNKDLSEIWRDLSKWKKKH